MKPLRRWKIHVADHFYRVFDVAQVTQPADNFVAIGCHVKPFFHLRIPEGGGRESVLPDK